MVPRAAEAIRTRVIKTAVQTRDMNATCECFLGSVRCDLGRTSLSAVLMECVRHFNHARPHQRLQQDAPVNRLRTSAHGEVVSFPVLAGLHHDYQRAA